MSDIDPLPSDLRSLFEDERAAYPKNPDARARVLRRIETVIALAPAAASAAPSGPANAVNSASAATGAVSGKAAALVAIAFAGGVAIGELHGRSAAPPALPAPSPSSSQALTQPGPSASIESPTPEVTASATQTASASPSAAPSTHSPDKSGPVESTDLEAEQALIDTARAALSRGRSADVLRAANEHATRFPRGRLSQEREMLAISALLMSGNRAGAEARGQRFKSAFPKSMYVTTIDELLGTTSKKDAGQ